MQIKRLWGEWEVRFGLAILVSLNGRDGDLAEIWVGDGGGAFEGGSGVGELDGLGVGDDTGVHGWGGLVLVQPVGGGAGVDEGEVFEDAGHEGELEGFVGELGGPVEGFG